MTDRDPVEHLAEAVSGLYDPTARLAEAVSAVFADAAKRDGGNQELHMRLMDGVAQGRALRARAESKYGDIGQMYDRLAARSALSARVWCLDGT